MTTAEPFGEINMSRFTQADVDAYEARRAAAKNLKAPRIETAASFLAGIIEKEKNEKAARLKASNHKSSHLEDRFIRLWTAECGPELEREVRFHSQRKWRADFAHRPSMTLIEIEGGAWGGRHTRGDGFQRDGEKYVAAFLAGWNVVRLTAAQLTPDTVRAVALRCAINSTHIKK